MADDQDNSGVRVPPPLIYLLALLLGLVLDRRLHVPFLSHGVARVLRWAGTRGVVRSDDARRRHYAAHRQARI